MNADFASKTVEAIRVAQKAGEPLHEIAILYRAAGPMVTTIRATLEEVTIPFIWERDERFPHGPLTRWLQRAAAWALTPAEERPPFTPLLREYLAWSGRLTGDQASAALLKRAELFEFLEKPIPPEMPLKPWLLEAKPVLDLRRIFQQREDTAQDQVDWEKLTSDQDEAPSLRAFAGPGQIKDKIVVTTLHASKGRQFGAVIIPGCAEGILPPWTWNRRRRGWDAPTPYGLSEARRLFYVGVTRARRAVHLIHAEQYEGKFGPVRLGRSRLVSEIAARLKQ
jgi:DNA helicase-2/ATP-dependent DNA helicase PcrA